MRTTESKQGPIRIVIYVSGGIVQDVLAGSKGAEAMIVDLLNPLAYPRSQRVHVAVYHEVGPDALRGRVDDALDGAAIQTATEVRMTDARVEVTVAEDDGPVLQTRLDELLDHLSIPRHIEQELGHVPHLEKVRIPGDGSDLLRDLALEHTLVAHVVHGVSLLSKAICDPVGKTGLSAPVNTLEIDE